MKYLIQILLTCLICGCYSTTGSTPPISETDQPQPSRVANDAYLYSMLAANAYKLSDNKPFILPPNIQTIKYEDSQVNKPSRKYTNSKVYDNGSFQAKVFLITPNVDINQTNNKQTIVIAYRGTQNFVGGDMFVGSIGSKHKELAVMLYEEIKAKHPTDKTCYV